MKTETAKIRRETTTDTAVDFKSFEVEGNEYRIPKSDYLFNFQHSWLRIDGDRAILGVSDVALDNVSEVKQLDAPAVGVYLNAGDEVGSLEGEGEAFSIISPIDGKVTAVNLEVIENPEIISEDPYRAGWVAQIEIDDPYGYFELLMDTGEYFSFAEAKVKTGPGAEHDHQLAS